MAPLVKSFDPGAVDLVDKLLVSQPEESEAHHLLRAAREFLDNFSFAEAEQVLSQADHNVFT